MVKVLAIGDLHFKKGSPAMSDLVIQKLKEKVEEHTPDLIVFLGDTLDTHEKIDMTTLNKAVGMFKMFALTYPTVIIIGNHDRPDSTTNQTDNSSFFCLKGWPNIYVADRILDIKYEVKNGKKVRFVFVPFLPPGTFNEALEKLDTRVDDPEQPATAVFAHQTFVGANIGPSISRYGDKWSLDYPLLISGHIHIFQKLQPNLLYPGTPYQQRFDDESEKGIFLCEFLPEKDPKINFLTLDIRKKKAISLKPHEVETFVPPPDCEVRVDIVGSLDDIQKLTSNGTIAKMRSQGVAVNLSHECTVDPRNPENKNFRDLLLDLINDDPDAQAMYTSIFQIDPETPTIKATPPTNLMDNLMNIVRTIKPTPAVGGNFIPQNPQEKTATFNPALMHTDRAKITETPSYLVDEKGEPATFRPAPVDIQKSFMQSVAEEKAKPPPATIQSLMNAALKNK